MEDNVFLFTAKIYKYGTEEVLEECQIMGYNLFQATHILVDYVHENSKFKMPIELGSVERLRMVNNIINPEFWAEMVEDEDDNEYTGDIPLNIAKNLGEDQVIAFECECHEKLKVPAHMGFPFVTCPNCENNIKRSEIKNFGGIWVYEKDDKK